jgi:hypothetical protein
MEPTERLIRKASDYEVLAESHAERAPLEAGTDHRAAAVAFAVAAIILREVAAALDCEECG